MAFLERLSRGRLGPIWLALLFAVCSVPVVLVNVHAYDPATYGYARDEVPLPFSDPAVLVGAFGAVLTAALFASAIGGWVARRHTVLGILVTIPIAWASAIIALPVWPSLFGWSYGAAPMCIDGCNLEIVGIAGGLRALLGGWWISWVFEPLTLATLAFGVTVWAVIVRRTSSIQTAPVALPPGPTYWRKP